MARLTCLVLAAAVAAAGARARTVGPPPAAKVREAALATWIHGITAETAEREIGSEGVPYLLEMLRDPAFPRRDNVVAFLAFLGSDAATADLLAMLRSPGPASVPEEDRALLLAPRALGHIASRGGGAALGALLAMTAPGSEGGPLAPAARAAGGGLALRDDLLEMALRGLALSRAPEARERLGAIAEGRLRPAPRGRDLRAVAAAARASMAEGAAADRRRPADVAAVPGSPASPAVAAATAYQLDGNPRVQESSLTWASHVGVPSPMSESRLDALSREATLRAARDDYDGDIACCIGVSRGGLARTFGAADDGLDVIDDSGEMNAVLGDSVARVKVVREIHWCGGAGENIVGCSRKPGDTIAVVRLSDLAAEGILWIHEYGHNVGLDHTGDPREIMHGTNNGGNRGLDQDECDAFHFPPAAARMSPADVGSCEDVDLDGVHDVADNCAGIPNFEQGDADGDGLGDLCEAPDSDGDGIADALDNCPTISNRSQSDADRDRIGDACDPCTDRDGDGLGSPGDPACPRGAEPDCDDLRPAVRPGAPEVCDGFDNDCDAAIDEARCEDFDVNADLEVDGVELAWLGRAFGLCGPALAWWSAVDYTMDGCIDGDDLAILAAAWRCDAPGPICR